LQVAIVGAGLSGLTTAFYLRRTRPDLQLVVYEAAARPGGTMQSEVVDGVRFETGANGFLTNKPDCLRLVRDCGLEHRLLRSSDASRVRYVFHDRLHRLPASPPEFLATRLLTWREKLRVLREPFIPQGPPAGDETVREFGDRRLGPAFSRVFLEAMCAGIYGATPERLSLAAAFPLLAALERDHGGLFKGMLARRRAGAGPGGVLMSLHDGVGELAARLAETSAEWRWQWPVRAIVPVNDGYEIVDHRGAERYERVIVCTPAFVASRLVDAFDAELGAHLAAIAYTPIAVVGLAYRTSQGALDGFGVLTTRTANAPILGFVCDSNVFPGRAPEGMRSLRVLIGGQRNPELVEHDDSTLIETARAGVRLVTGADPEPVGSFVRRWPRGIPLYEPGHLARIAAMDERLARWPGLHLNANAYRGVAMNDCVRNSRELAERLVGRS
jgi:oxygen-dependent protoporphyrinogen oxidase